MNAIQAKDEINYAKSSFKVFYSHYETLVLRKVGQDELEREYKNDTQIRGTNFNPPTEVLYLTMANPKHEEEIISRCKEYKCQVVDLEWRQNSKDKWMCLV